MHNNLMLKRDDLPLCRFSLGRAGSYTRPQPAPPLTPTTLLPSRILFPFPASTPSACFCHFVRL